MDGINWFSFIPGSKFVAVQKLNFEPLVLKKIQKDQSGKGKNSFPFEYTELKYSRNNANKRKPIKR